MATFFVEELVEVAGADEGLVAGVLIELGELALVLLELDGRGVVDENVKAMLDAEHGLGIEPVGWGVCSVRVLVGDFAGGGRGKAGVAEFFVFVLAVLFLWWKGGGEVLLALGCCSMASEMKKRILAICVAIGGISMPKMLFFLELLPALVVWM